MSPAAAQPKLAAQPESKARPAEPAATPRPVAAPARAEQVAPELPAYARGPAQAGPEGTPLDSVRQSFFLASAQPVSCSRTS